jgi:hypothetical protein
MVDSVPPNSLSSEWSGVRDDVTVKLGEIE